MKKIILILFLFFTISPVFAKELNIVQVTDVHLSTSGQTESNRDLSESVKNLKLAVLSINKLKKIDFVMFSGDLIDQSNPEQLVEFFKIVKNLKYPYYVLMGNHDVHSISGMSKDVFLEIVSKSNPNQKKATGNYCFYPKKGFMVAVVDGAVPMMPSAHGYFSHSSITWLDKILKDNEDEAVIIFQHYPIMPPRYNPSHEVLNAKQYNTILNKHNNVILIASGHFHTAKVQKDDKGIIHISTPALINAEREYRVINIKYKKPLFSDVKNIEVNTFLKSI